MDVYSKYLEEASRTIKIADHMLSVTYPLVKDTKLLLAILQNLFITLDNSIAALVNYERFYKEIPPFQNNFESRFNSFTLRCAPKYNIDKKHLHLIKEIQTLIKEHKQSPVEFIKQDKFVICSGNYNLKTLSTKNIKTFLEQTKSFMDNIIQILDKNTNESK